ncbi:hypothetical protein ACFQY5_24440 [Paeniroseomonas aquatica]|uniref:hypothetical protein n=1 Tax=Paeniroseomonas aquatica TaxID=373043 RepID=UPI00360FA5AD
MEPAAPARFSMTTGWPRAACTGPATRRIGASTLPPAGQATMMRSGRTGQAGEGTGPGPGLRRRRAPAPNVVR